MVRRFPALLAVFALFLAAALPALARAQDEEGVLPGARVLAYYGFPGNPNMGILGEYDPDELLARLEDQAAAYEAADPDRPLVLAFEVIATVAQPNPGDDGTFTLGIDEETLQQYADYTAERDMLLFLDVQIGRDSVANQIDFVRPFLELPHVHLAIDPEFAIAEGETPGQELGSLDASAITEAQEILAALAEEQGIPPKILIVHQFNVFMISNKEQIEPVPGVQLVIDADGFGTPEEKRASYEVVITDSEIEFNGFKLFYQQDEPLMTAEDVLALDPAPDVVIYQ
jgi:hypothetical protein